MTEILRNSTFRRLFTAQVVALLGTGLLTVALGLLAYDIAGPRAGAVLGTALAIKMFAYVLVAPVVSSMTCGVSRRALLVGSDIVRGGVALLLPWVDQVWQIYILIFVLQAASATFTPAFQALIPRILVDDAQYTRALSLSRAAYDLESLLSPVIAAALLTVTSYHSLFLGTVFGFAISALLVRTTILPQAPAPTVADFWARSTLGMRLMFGRPPLRSLLAMNICVAAATALVVVNTVVYVHEFLGLTSTAVALLLACYGGGSMLIAMSLPLALRRFGDRTVMLTGTLVIITALASTAMLVISASDSGVALAICWILLGAGASLITTPTARLLRDESTPEQQPSVFTAQFSLSHACFLVTYPAAGWLGVAVSESIAVGALCAVSVVAGITAVRCWPPKDAPAPGHADTRIGVAGVGVD